MGKQFLLWARGVALSIVVVAVLAAGCRSAPVNTSPAPVSKPGPAVSAPVAYNAPGGVPREGIKVHGRWTIEVRNPDGTLVERREFDNALQASGALNLAQILGRNNSVGGWTINIGAVNQADQAFLNSLGDLTGALITESTHALSETEVNKYVFKNLTVNAPTSGNQTGTLILSGFAVAGRDGKIERVSTTQYLLAPTVAPGSVYTSSGTGFTATTLSSPVNLSTGQQVAVTVVISFSSP